MGLDNRMQRGKLSKYGKEPSSSALVIMLAPQEIKYINVVFVRIDVVTRARIMKGYEVKKERLEEIEHVYKFNFRDSVNTDNTKAQPI